MSTSIEDAVVRAILEIASISRSPVTKNKNGTAFSFFTPTGFCLIGYTKWYIDNGYFDLRWRVFIGEVTSSFSHQMALEENHRLPDTPYGITTLNSLEILTITDSYRFLVSWGAEEIKEVIILRFGGAFATPLALPGIKPLSEQFFQQMLQNYGFDRLLSRARVEGRE